MNSFAQLLQPDDPLVSGLRTGQYAMNEGANRVTDTGTGRFVAALVPGEAQQRALSGLPMNTADAAARLAASPGIAQLVPVLKAMQLANTVGALASVANLGISCMGFALVLQRLGRIEGKLDDMLTKLDVLQDSVRERSDAACTRGVEELAHFGVRIAELTAQLRVARDVTDWTAKRLEGFALDAELPSELGVEPYEIVRAVRAAKGDGLYVLQRPRK